MNEELEGTPNIAPSEYMTIIFYELIKKGWLITQASCTCGGKHAWVRPLESGAYEMVGCICHKTPKKL